VRATPRPDEVFVRQPAVQRCTDQVQSVPERADDATKSRHDVLSDARSVSLHRLPMNTHIEILWRFPTYHCELVFVGLAVSRLRVWMQGRLHADEEVFDFDSAMRRARELRRSIVARLYPPPRAAATTEPGNSAGRRRKHRFAQGSVRPSR